MFSEQDVKEFVEDEFCEDNWGQIINLSKLVDPLMEQSGPQLHEEFDMQEWQKLILLSTPMSVVHDRAEPTCLQVKRISSGSNRFYYKAGYRNSWGDYDLEEMCKELAPKVPHFDIKVLEDEPIIEVVTHDTSVALEEEVKTRMQITLKRQGVNVRGHTGNFVVHGVTTSSMMNILLNLVESYPKIRHAEQTVRIQFTEYRVGGGAYRPERGGNMNLHNAEVGPVVAFVSTKLVSEGFSLRNREWVHSSQVTVEGVAKTNQRLSEIKKIIDRMPDSIDVTNIPYSNVHKGMWCLCRVRDGRSWVLSASKDVDRVLHEQKEIEKFTYVLNPNGSIHKERKNV